MTQPASIRWVDRFGAAALIILAACLPFELASPALTLPVLSLSVTGVELLMYVAVLAWALSAILGALSRLPGPRSRPLGQVAILGFMGALIASAIVAREPRLDAAKFALRSLMGACLAFAAARAAAIPRVRAGLILAVAAGGALSATLGAVETIAPEFQAALSPFRTQSFSLAGYPRAMGTFQYPTIAAMFWEATALLAVAALAAKRRPWAAVAVVGAIFGLALAGTLSRAGLVFSVAGLIMLAAVARWRFRFVLSGVLAGLAGFVIGAGAIVIGSPALVARLSAENDTVLNRADVGVVAGAPSPIAAGGTFSLTLDLTNRGIETWPATGPRAVVASYHWIDQQRTRHVVFEGLRTRLSADIAAGAGTRLAIHIAAPDRPGNYILQVDLQRLDGAWFTQKGNRMPELAVTVTGPGVLPEPALPVLPVDAFVPPEEQGEVGRLELWGVAWRMATERPVFGVGPDNFRHLYGAYLGRQTFNTSIHANSLYFEALGTMGALGLVVVLGLGLAVARQLRQLLLDGSATSESWLMIAILVASAAFFAHGLLDYFFEFTPTYALFWLLFGCAAPVAGAQPGRAP